MNRAHCVALLVSSVLTVLAPETMAATASPLRTPETGREVTACVQVNTTSDFALVGLSKIVASRVFERIGVRRRWSCEQPALAQLERKTSFILIRLVGDAPYQNHKGALAYARPYAKTGVRVVVFYDRFQSILVSRPFSARTILGYVFAHELGHVLSGVAAHGDRGRMRARWTSADFDSMAALSLGFAAEDAALIRNNVQRDFDQGARAASSQRPFGNDLECGVRHASHAPCCRSYFCRSYLLEETDFRRLY